ncbi:MAG TPA: hypothetical protein VGR80_14245 [Steroidobacteraceae bacterium]|nr:hypothetical protein [Gammaproteobacteria bacterium]HEV2287202.1 hypothetical protein [Steroidobacteraceae bacterium]
MPPRLLPITRRGTRRRAAAWALTLLAAALGPAALAAAGDKPPKAKPSSFAPHHTASHVYGTPIAKPILHKRSKHAKSTARAPAAPIK